MSDDEKTTNSRPWAKMPGETTKSREAFMVYLEMGPARSLRRVAEKMKRPTGYRRLLEQWSSRFDWVDRTCAFDEQALGDLERLLPAIRRDELRLMAERARQAGVEIWDIARGEFKRGAKYPVRDHHGNVIGNKPSIPPATRLKAATRIREELGIIPPKRVEMSGRDGEEIRVAAATAKGLDDETLNALVSATAALAAARGIDLPKNVEPESTDPVGIGPSYPAEPDAYDPDDAADVKDDGAGD